MKRQTQYVLLLAVIGVAVGLSYIGFVYTGGAVPWGERFAAVMQGGLGEAGGPLIQMDRGGIGGFLLAGPLRDNVLSYVVLVLILAGASIGLYWWAGKTDGTNR